MPLIATRGAASAQGFGEFAQSAAPNYIEQMFSTYLFTGTGTATAINNGIDLSTKGGLVWIKDRNSGVMGHALFDTVRGGAYKLQSQWTGAQTSYNNIVFGTTGFTNDTITDNNNSGTLYSSWTFREQPKFFDVVTYTGNGSDPRNIAHNLGSVPGCMIIKCTSNGATDWFVYHGSLGNSRSLNLNQAGAGESGTQIWGTTTPTSTVFTVGNINANTNGRTYVAYLFAHDAGGFGLSGNENVISCGSLSASTLTTVTLGYEPQWIMIKKSSGTGDWYMLDVMRGMSYTIGNILEANLADAEFNAGQLIIPTATGFQFNGINFGSTSGETFIYVAIRRGPMAVPTLGTSVFAPVAVNNSFGTFNTVGFPFDLAISKNRSSAAAFALDRLRGINSTDSTANLFPLIRTTGGSAEDTASNVSIGVNNTGFKTSNNYAGLSTIYWNFQRAPTFMDVVCYVGTGVARTVSHNLQAVPELMIVRRRTPTGGEWWVYSKTIGNTTALFLNTDYTTGATPTVWNNTTPTSSVFTVGTYVEVNGSGSNMVAYLFATCPGVSKVGSYTGTGTTQAIACGFTTGARFVLIKRTDSAADWYVWDSARGIVAGNDPYLLINSTAAEVTNTDYIDTSAAGFEISSTAPAAINAVGGSYIFLAVA